MPGEKGITTKGAVGEGENSGFAMILPSRAELACSRLNSLY